MLPAASNLFLSEIGRGHLHKLHSLDESDKVKPLSIVMKKKRWYWFHSKVDPTSAHIGDLLKAGQNSLHIEIKEASEVTDFESSTTFSVKGEIGGKLAKLFQMKLSASDQIKFHAPLGKIMMSSVDPSQLCNALSKLEMDKTNVFVSGCLNNSWKKSMNLAIVTETWYVANEVKLTASVELEASAEATTPSESVHASGSLERTKEFIFTLQPGTAIAYQTLDLKIDKTSGNIRCVPDAVSMKMYCGFCFFAQDTVDGDDSPPGSVSEIRALPAAELKSLREHLIVILSNPGLVKQLFYLIDAIESKEEDLKIDVDLCEEKVKNAVRSLLTSAGLAVSDEFSIKPVDISGAFFHAVAVIVSAMRELPDEVMFALDELSADEIQRVADAVNALLRKWEASGEIEAVVDEKDAMVSKFLHILGVFSENGYAKHYPRVLEALYKVLTCLFEIQVKN